MIVLSQWRYFHLKEQVTIAGEGLHCMLGFITIDQWGVISMPKVLRHGTPIVMVISYDQWHSHLEGMYPMLLGLTIKKLE